MHRSIRGREFQGQIVYLDNDLIVVSVRTHLGGSVRCSSYASLRPAFANIACSMTLAPAVDQAGSISSTSL